MPGVAPRNGFVGAGAPGVAPDSGFEERAHRAWPRKNRNRRRGNAGRGNGRRIRGAGMPGVAPRNYRIPLSIY